MIQDIKSHLHDWTDPEETSAYLRKLLNKEAFDHSGLIYGIGHAVYSISDPREQILRSFVNQLAVEKGRQDDLALYRNIEEEAPKLISKNRPIYKGSAPTSTCTAGSSTTCWASRWNCTPPSSPSPGSWAGAPTASRSWCA